MTLLLADVQTLLLVILALSLTLGAAVGLAARDSRAAELRFWAAGMLMHGLCYLLFMQRGSWPDWLSIVAANVLLAGSFSLLTLAVARFGNARLPAWLLWGLPAAVALSFPFLLEHHDARVAIGSAIFLLQQLAILQLLMRKHAGKRERGQRLLIVGIATIAVVFAARGAGVMLGVATIPNLTAQSPLQTLSYLLGIVALLLASLGFVFMVKERIERYASEARHLLTTIFDSSDETIAMFDRDGTLLAINNIGAKRFNTTPQRMVGMKLADAMPAEVAARRLSAIQQVADTGKSKSLVDQRAGRVYLQTFYPVEGESQRVVAFATDITEKLAAEEALRQRLEETIQLNKKLEEAQNQLLQSEKMASIGQLAAGVAHELNNPIGFVNSNLGTLRTYIDDIFMIADAYETALRASGATDPACEAVRTLKAAKDFDFLRQDIVQLLGESADGLQRVKKIVQDLKDFSRPGETNWQWADLHAGLDSTLNIVWNELKYKCTVKKDYGELPPVRCLLSQLNQVFMNLLVNAAHAIEIQGDITIATRRLGEDAVQISIADTGKGIAPEHLNRIFEPFFTTKPVGKGTGLGLSIAWGIINKHHGKIEVASEVGKGTTFTITLPVDPPADDGAAVSPAPTFEG
jgi:PAS domain S-box-containing protein